MSPLTLDRIRRANGNVRIKEEAGVGHAIQVLEGGAWITVFVNTSKSVCEQAVRGAAGNVILG